MITKKFKNFYQAYNEFYVRHFDIFQINGNSLVGKLIGKAPEELQEHLKTRPRITKKGKLWIVEADSNFYCNKAFYEIEVRDSKEDERRSSNAYAMLVYGVPKREIHDSPRFHRENLDLICFRRMEVDNGISVGMFSNTPMKYPPTRDNIRYAKEKIKDDLKRKHSQVNVVVSHPELIRFFGLDKKGIELVVKQN